MSDITYAYLGDLTKSRDEQGFLHIKGVATDDTLDLDGQICDPQWLEGAMAQWFKTGNIREMHQPSAVGKATKMTQDGAKFSIEAKIVDPIAAMKFDEGVYTGLSIGIKGARIDESKEALKRAPNGIIMGGRIVEVSGVDLPANPTAVLEMVKTVGGVTVKTEVLGDIEEAEVVEETEEVQAEEVVELKGINPELVKSLQDLTKAETHDPAELQAIRSGFVSLINAELSELASGADDEISDLYQLLNSLSTFLSWWEDEADEGETTEPFPTDSDDGDDMAYIAMGISPDLVKRAGSPDATEDDKTEFKTELLKSLGLDEIATKTELEELREANESLKAALKDVREMAAPGQPALRATQDLQVKSAEADELETRALNYRNTALAMTDKAAMAQYVEAADTLMKRAREIRQPN